MGENEIKQKEYPYDMNSKNVDLLQLFIENARDYAIIILDLSGKILTWNLAAERLKGWKAKEIIGQSFTKFYTHEDIAKGKPQKELEEVKKSGRFEDEAWRVCKDGKRFWANVILTAIRDEEGKLCGYGKITRDFTERKEAEEKIKKQAQEILEMATVPVVQIWEGIVLVPLIGTLDSSRTHQLMERLLQYVTDTNSPVAIIDITGVPTIDTQTAQHLIETISAARLVGANVIMTGIRPIIAQTMVHLGIDLSSIITRSSLVSGLKEALDILDIKIEMKQK